MSANTQVHFLANFTRQEKTQFGRIASSEMKLSINLEIKTPRRRKRKKVKTVQKQDNVRLLKQKNAQAAKPRVSGLTKALRIAGLVRFAAKQLKGII